MAYAHCEQVSPRTELREPWFPDRSLLARCPNLLAVSSTGAGYDVVDVDACTEMGILVVNQSGTNKVAVAEHALDMMLCVSHQRSEDHTSELQSLLRISYAVYRWNK